MDHQPISQATYQSLVEKNKELTCLYGIAQIIIHTESPFNDKLKAIAELLVPAFQFPEITTAHVRLDHYCYKTPDFESSKIRISEKVIVQGKERGLVEMGYCSNYNSISYTKER